MKKFNLFLTQWENASLRPLSRRQKEMQVWEAVRGSVTWDGWSRMEATPGKKKSSSSATDEKSSPGSHRWIAFTKALTVCLHRKELLYDTMKSYYRPQNTGYYVYDTVLLSNTIMPSWNGWLIHFITLYSLISTVLKMAKLFFALIYEKAWHMLNEWRGLEESWEQI